MSKFTKSNGFHRSVILLGLFTLIILCQNSPCNGFDLSQLKAQADSIIQECDSTNNSIRDDSSLILSASKLLYNASSMYIYLMQVTIGNFEDDIYNGEVLLLVQYHYLIENQGVLLPFLAKGKCSKSILEVLAKREVSKSKKFKILIDFYAFYKKMADYWKNPPGTNGYESNPIDDLNKYSKKLDKFRSQLRKYNKKLNIIDK